jgi:hypothetical protein
MIILNRNTPSIVNKSNFGNYRYVFVKVVSDYNGFGYITELEFYDENNILIPYITYPDSINQNTYWTREIWDRTNLNDNNINYTDNSTGCYSTTYLYAGNIFYVDFQSEVDISKISVWIGAPEGYMALRFNFYGTKIIDPITFNVDNYQLLGSIIAPQVHSDIREYSLSFN